MCKCFSVGLRAERISHSSIEYLLCELHTSFVYVLGGNGGIRKVFFPLSLKCSSLLRAVRTFLVSSGLSAVEGK